MRHRPALPPASRIHDAETVGNDLLRKSAIAFSPQSDVLAWFGSNAGQALLAAEAGAVAAALAGNDAQPWLWLSAATAPGEIPAPAGRGLRLAWSDGAFQGAVRCALPLPLPSESVGRLVIQHAGDDGGDDLIEECDRVLAPGGRLWLFCLNPWSPYRRHWRRAGLAPRDAMGWRLRLYAAGLQVAPQVNYLGRCARVRAGDGPLAMLRAACLLSAEKRTAGTIHPLPSKPAWRTAGAAAGLTRTMTR